MNKRQAKKIMGNYAQVMYITPDGRHQVKAWDRGYTPPNRGAFETARQIRNRVMRKYGVHGKWCIPNLAPLRLRTKWITVPDMVVCRLIVQEERFAKFVPCQDGD